MLDLKELNEIKERESKATKGPWGIDPRNLLFYNKDQSMVPLSNELCLSEDAQNGDCLGANIVGPLEPDRACFVVRDAWFIAKSREDIPRLIEALERAIEVIRFYSNMIGGDFGPELGDKAREFLKSFERDEK